MVVIPAATWACESEVFHTLKSLIAPWKLASPEKLLLPIKLLDRVTLEGLKPVRELGLPDAITDPFR